MKHLLKSMILVAFASTAAWANDSPEALQQAFVAALKNNDAEGLATCYTADAVNFPVGSMIGLGPDFVRDDWNGFFSTYKVLEVSLSMDHLETHGDTAVAWGLFSMTVVPVEGGESVEMNGRFMDVARNLDGKWLYVADHASVPLPPPPEE